MDTKIFEISGKRIWVTDHRGMVGSAVVRRLANETCEILTVAHSELRLKRQADAIVIAAAPVGGIHANSTLPAEFLSINLLGSNVVSAANRVGVRRLVNLGRSCMYPVGALQPIAEDASKFGGAPHRLLDNSRRATLGWSASTDLADGLGQMYHWYCNNKVHAAT